MEQLKETAKDILDDTENTVASQLLAFLSAVAESIEEDESKACLVGLYNKPKEGYQTSVLTMNKKAVNLIISFMLHTCATNRDSVLQFAENQHLQVKLKNKCCFLSQSNKNFNFLTLVF